MSGWLKQQMVPIFLVDDNIPVSYGRLKRVWLGGLVNPQALLTAFMHEVAMECGCLIDQMAVSCDMLAKADSYDEDGGIVFYGTHLQGAEWDVSQQCLTSSRQDVNPMPDIYMRPVHVVEEETGAPNKFLCPVFMNKARQVCAFHLPLTTSDNAADAWTLAGTAIILDRGLCMDTLKKPRAVDVSVTDDSQDNLAASHRPPTIRTNIGSHQSTSSQLSYKPMSPQAPALPPDLQQLQREKPVSDSHFTDKSSQPADDNKEKHDQSSRGSSVTSGRSVKSATLMRARKTSRAGSEASQSQHEGDAPGTADMSKSETSVKQEQGESDGSTHSQVAADMNKNEAYDAGHQGQTRGSGESRLSTTSTKGTSGDRQEQAATPRHSSQSSAPSVQKTSDESEPPTNTPSMHSDDDDKRDSNSQQQRSDNSDATDAATDDPTDDTHAGDVNTSVDYDITTQRADHTKDTVE